MIARWPLVGRDEELAELRRLLGAGRGSNGVAVFGDAGVGKTRLVAEVVDGFSGQGTTVEWVRATAAASKIPLGAFSHLLAPDIAVHQRDDLLHVAMARLDERAGKKSLLLTVDDAHLLDEMSVALLDLALTQLKLGVLLSVRTGEPLPPGLVGLWKDNLVVRLDVAPLTRDATETLVLEVLGEDVPASLLDRVWRLSRGNALFVRELVTAVVECRQLNHDHRHPVLPVEPPQARLRELVEERLRLLELGWRAALELIAVGEQVPLDAAERLTASAHVEALERRGLVEITDAGPAGTVQVAHPLYGEVLAAGLPRLRRRAILRDLVEAVKDLDHFDRLRLASWCLESGEPGEPEELLRLAREALGRLDHQLAERLARAAGGPRRPDAGLVVGEALAGQGRVDDAEAVLAGLSPVDPDQVAQVAMARASHLFLHLDRSGEAYEVLQTAVTELASHPVWQAECRSVLVQMLMFSLRLADAGKLARTLVDSADTPATARVRAVSVAAVALGAEGQLDAAAALFDDTLYGLARRHRRDVPYGELQLRMARYQTLYWAGRVRELDDYTATNLGLDVEHPPPSLRGILAGFRGGALLARGRAHAALAELQRATRTLAETDWFGQRPLAEAMRARAAVFADDLVCAEEAMRAADEAFAADRLRGARTLPYIELSRAWTLAAQGEIATAAERCLALATAMEHVVKPLAVEALHAAARLGRAADAVAAIERLGAVVDGHFVAVVARHIRALATSDAELLAAVAADLEDLGAELLAAEAYRAAANVCRRDGRGAPAASASRRADELLRRCEMPFSPALEPVMPAGEELTWREREVALLAARGRTSSEIAVALYLSVRTVDTHLHRVYRKLAINGRHQLAQALGAGPGTTSRHNT